MDLKKKQLLFKFKALEEDIFSRKSIKI